ncbi:hypothetical protein ACRQ5Q_10455 [Bradyrhizobium sp. PMVTL-01]|uniref:hypothetical protein n=1 Tax=Bradyrhizobium sp. PMVTL-01 TaxID=3434999 RepID=UPI003F71E6C0
MVELLETRHVSYAFKAGRRSVEGHLPCLLSCLGLLDSERGNLDVRDFANVYSGGLSFVEEIYRDADVRVDDLRALSPPCRLFQPNSSS